MTVNRVRTGREQDYVTTNNISIMLSHWREIDATKYSYRVIQVIGFGGNAATYHVIKNQVLDDQSGPPTHGVGANYAMKLAYEDLSDERLDRFEAEKEFLKNADHPLILPYYEEGTFYDSPFMIIEYLPDTMGEIILSDEATISEKLNYATQLISSLVYIHNLDDPVVHRDIKPSNIFVRQNTAFLGDFGLIKRQSTDPDEDNFVMNKESDERAVPSKHPTPDLIEYEDGGELTTASDIYQMGIVLTKLFTGSNQNPVQDVHKREEGDPVVTEEIDNVPGTVVSDDIQRLLARMTIEDAEDRPNAEELLPEWKELLREATLEARRLDGRVL
jgi:serine/threonine protein kinase